jgi:hypothetical protein
MSITETTRNYNPTHRFFTQSKILYRAVLLFLFGIGLGLRLVDITDAPLDFHPWRQLRAASIARGIYYAALPDADPETRQAAISLGSQFETLEPKVFETIVAYTYKLVGGEHLWIARLYAILFWIIGGLALFLIARRATSDDGAIVSLAFYLFVPFGFSGSRAFLPEPLMIMFILLAVYAFQRWADENTWKWALLSGILAGIAIYIKVFAVYPLATAAFLVVLLNWGFKPAVKDPKVWAAAGIMFLIPAPYYLFGLSGTYSPGEYLSSWTLGHIQLLLQPGFYVRWMTVLHDLVNLTVLLPSLMGVCLLPPKSRALSLGMWIGYLLLGMSVPSLILSHTYYSLVVVPIIAFSLAPLGDLLLSRIAALSRSWQAFFLGVALLSMAYPIVRERNSLAARDYRLEVRGWEQLAEELPPGKLIGITHDYNTRLNYYGWRAVAPWPNASDIEMDLLTGEVPILDNPDWLPIFERKTQGYDYFIVTVFKELDAQPMLRSILYDTYEITAEDGRYILFDLNAPKNGS